MLHFNAPIQCILCRKCAQDKWWDGWENENLPNPKRITGEHFCLRNRLPLATGLFNPNLRPRNGSCNHCSNYISTTLREFKNSHTKISPSTIGGKVLPRKLHSNSEKNAHIKLWGRSELNTRFCPAITYFRLSYQKGCRYIRRPHQIAGHTYSETSSPPQ